MASTTSNELFEVAVKHHQWFSASYDDAQELVKHHEAATLQKQETVTARFQVNNRFHDPYNEGCYDEFYFISALYGYIENVSTSEIGPAGNSSLVFRIADKNKFVDQCHTFAAWSNLPQVPELQNALTSEGVLTMSGGITRPGTLSHFTAQSLKELRKSSFLFARKVDDGPAIQDTCETFIEASTRILLEPTVEPLEHTTADDVNFLEKYFKDNFFGTWIDVAKMDTIIECVEGGKPRELVLSARRGTNNEFIWGGYALICGKRVTLQFYNQILEGHLDSENGIIYWSNGAQWKKK